MKPWDIAPLDILVREAGGAFTISTANPDRTAAARVATNGLLHDAVLARLNGDVTHITVPCLSYSGVRYGHRHWPY